MEGIVGIEPTTHGLTVHRSNLTELQSNWRVRQEFNLFISIDQSETCAKSYPNLFLTRWRF